MLELPRFLNNMETDRASHKHEACPVAALSTKNLAFTVNVEGGSNKREQGKRMVKDIGK